MKRRWWLAPAVLLAFPWAGAVAEKLPTFEPMQPAPLPPVQCFRQGTIRIEIGQHALRIPRAILASVTPPFRTAVAIPCRETTAKADSLLIRVSRTQAGDAFLEDWIRNVRLPTQIEIRPPGRLKSITQDQFEQVARRRGGAKPAADGLDSIAVPSTVYYRGRSPSGAMVHIACSTIRLIHAGHLCGSAYRTVEFDVYYQFADANLAQSEWLAMDDRFRAFLKKLESDAANSPMVK